MLGVLQFVDYIQCEAVILREKEFDAHAGLGIFFL